MYRTNTLPNLCHYHLLPSDFGTGRMGAYDVIGR